MYKSSLLYRIVNVYTYLIRVGKGRGYNRRVGLPPTRGEGGGLKIGSRIRLDRGRGYCFVKVDIRLRSTKGGGLVKSRR